MTNTKLVLTIAAASVMLLWLALAVVGPRKISAAIVLRYGSVLRILSLIFALIPPTLMIYVIWSMSENQARLLIAGGAFLATSLIAGLLLIETERTQIALTDDAITRYSPWRGVTTLRWSEIERVRYSAANRWFVIDGIGRTIRVSRNLGDVKAFADAVRTRVPPERWTSAAGVLDALARA